MTGNKPVVFRLGRHDVAEKTSQLVPISFFRKRCVLDIDAGCTEEGQKSTLHIRFYPSRVARYGNADFC